MGYDAVKSLVKIIATNGEQSKESNEAEVWFTEDDDNIPPKIAKDVSLHDGRLSYDGHFFEYENLIIEDEGHLAEYFNYYYMPYNSSWGDSLPKADASIENLPGGKTEYKGNSWRDDVGGARYNLRLAIPVYGLPDGEYMFFAKVYDIYGNFTYVTLGKANIGTFKNKLKVELVRDNLEDFITKNPGLNNNEIMDQLPRHFKATLKLEGNEQNFERNMINIQEFSNYKDEYTGEDVQKWRDFYGPYNQLQECVFDAAEGILWNDNYEQATLTPHLTADTYDDKEVYFIDDWDDENNKLSALVSDGEGLPAHYPIIAPRNLYRGGWFKITLQSFNEHYIIKNVRDGVDKIYGRPYHHIYRENKNQFDPWGGDVVWYVDGETKYDVCTEETVSNTVYCYVPDEYIDDDGRHHIENLSDIKSSFFPEIAQPLSNHAYLVNIIAAGRDLGNDVDEWERRGKIIKTHFYKPDQDPNDAYYDEYKDPSKHPFDINVARQDMAASNEKGDVYYVAVVHFADGSSAVSDTFTMFGF